MIDLRVKGDVTKGRLVEATETLIAQKGFDAVSVRDITGLAKANVAAVNYHFGSREGLLAAVLEYRIKPVVVERAKRLEALDPQATLRAIFQAWSEPLLAATASKGLDEAAHARVLGRGLEMLAAGTYEEISAAARLVDATMREVLASHLPSLSAEEISWRLHFAQGALIHALVHGASVLADFRLTTALDRWIDATMAQFAAADGMSDRQLGGDKANTPRRKGKTASPLRQIAEVVAAAMEVDEMPVAEVVDTPATELLDVEIPAPQEEAVITAVAASKPARSKKAKAQDDMGELFLF
jgi:AcrR family transcriptional regulator